MPNATRGSPTTTSRGEISSNDDSLDDSEGDGDSDSPIGAPTVAHPFDGMSDADLSDAFRHHPESLGSVSIGAPNSGALMNGVRPPPSSLYRLVDPDHAWGTQETVDSLVTALTAVARAHPNTPAVNIGHISGHSGGPLSPHRSHQSGRDVDVGLYYADPSAHWYTHSDGANLDVARCWTLLKALAAHTDIEMVLLDIQLQKLIEQYALSVEHDSQWVHLIFHGDGRRPPLLRHAPGHATHFHLRFFNPVARRSALRLAPLLPEVAKATAVTRPTPQTRTHVAKPGDTLVKLAQRYKTTMGAIRSANHMRDWQLVSGRTYVIPATPNENEKRR